ncbi:MAG TPA: CoA-binding protein [Thermoplasmatales archaeon]|nr:CoA-binding protein [Thermoplasmatales archaeon]
MALITQPQQVRRIAREAEVVAVVGMSLNRERSSYNIADRVRGLYRMYYVNPVYAGEEVRGETILSSLREVPEHIDIVDVFRNPRHVAPIMEEAVAVGGDVVWLQPGSESPEVIDAYRDKIDIIAHACLGVVVAGLS